MLVASTPKAGSEHASRIEIALNAREYATLIARRWRLIGACVIIGVASASFYVSFTTKIYVASTRLFVSTTDGGGSGATEAYQGGLFSQQRVISYADIVETPPVLQPVIDRLGLPFTVTQLAARVSASAPLNTVLININVRDSSPVEAQAIANATGSQFVAVVNALEQPLGRTTSPIKISVVQQASLPIDAVSPKRRLDVAVAALLGLTIGIGLAALRETLDTTLSGPDDMQRIAPGVSTLGVIGFDSEAAKRPLIVEVSPHSPRAEAFRQLRTNLRFVDPDHPLRSVVVTSAVPREGKSTTVANLGITLARADVSVLIIEADLRRPRLGRYLNVPEDAAGLSDVLIGHVLLEAAIRRYGDDGPFVLGAGSKPPNPSELLGSAAMGELLEDVSRRFDIVLIDAPPLLPVTDAALVSRFTDGVLYVTNAGKTKREQIVQAMASLKSVDARVLGVVFNMVGLNSSGGSGYAYGYGYYGYYGEVQTKSHWWQRREVTPPAAVGVAPTPAGLPEVRLDASREAPLRASDVPDSIGVRVAEEVPTADVEPDPVAHVEPDLRPVQG